MPRGDCSFQVLERINGNTYKVDLSGEYDVSITLNVTDFTLFDTSFHSRLNPFEKSENDMDHPMNTNDPLHVPNGPFTRFKVNALKEKLNGLVVQVLA